jgi:hypothetical protein
MMISVSKSLQPLVNALYGLVLLMAFNNGLNISKNKNKYLLQTHNYLLTGSVA